MERLLALVGIVFFLGLTYLLSSNRKAVNWRTVGVGLASQIALAVFVLKTTFGQKVFSVIGDAVTHMLSFTDVGSRMMFGEKVIDEGVLGFVFAFQVLPTVIFISAFFSLLYHFGVLQFIVRCMAWVMMRFMNVSGAESLTSAANVFMGHTEAPLIVKPYLEKMTQSELLTVMIAGMASIAGGVMAAYIGMGIEAKALLTASVMAAPGAIVITKILVPETEEPVTRGVVKVQLETSSVNFVDALARGASDGMKLAINIAAMLIAFLAFVAMVDAVLGAFHDDLSLAAIFGKIFAPVAYLIGVPSSDTSAVAGLLGTKLVLNEFVAYSNLIATEGLSPRGSRIAIFALCGFANIGAVGIQLGGIGALAPGRRNDLARNAFRALYGGFVASLLSAAIAGVLMDDPS